MKPLASAIVRSALALALAAGASAAPPAAPPAKPSADPDPVAAPPAPWSGRLAPIPRSDLSGAEPLMREAIAAARAQVARLLADPAARPGSLARAYGRLGALLVLREVEAPADVAFRNARALDPTEPRWPYYAGYLAMMSGNADRALAYLESARALDPEYPPVYLRLGKVQLDRNDLDAARAHLERAGATPGLAAAARFYLGQIAILERRHRDAVTHLSAALAADPAATQVHWPLAQAYRALGQDDLARVHLAQVAPRTPQAEDPLLEELQGAARQSVPAFERGVYAVAQRDFRTAAAELAAGLAVDPDNRAARVSYARALYLTGDRAGAVRELGRALAGGPPLPLGLYFQAVLAEESGDTQSAAGLYRRVLELEPEHPGARYGLANLEFAADRPDLAAAHYRRLLDGEGAPAPAALLAAIAEDRAGAPESATLAALESILARSPADPQARYARIRLLAAARDRAVHNPQRALALAGTLAFEQPSPPALRALALAQAATGDPGAAAQSQSQALALSGGWLPPPIREAMEGELAAYREGRLPETASALDDPLLAPPPVDPVGLFRDYPAAVPY